MNYSFSNNATKEFLRLDKRLQLRILNKLEFFLSQNNPLDFAKHIVGGKNIYRFRIGNHRLIFEFLEKEILVLKVAIRGSVYKKNQFI
jgi:mRNA-degrading endonuclease RelE of RelBE toxin-antitoxin system